MKTFTVRGARIHSRADLFTELGHAVNGTGGYFGSNLDALAELGRKTLWQGAQDIIFRAA